MFTDGLVEDRTQDLDAGLSVLAHQLDSHVHRDVDSCLDKILATLPSGTTPGTSADDVAALLLRRTTV